jgi:exodeoxyribonuclease-3
MKIVTWNCNMAFRKKASLILEHQPDILVIPECEHPDNLVFAEGVPKPNDMLWFGKNRHKGLGIFSYSHFRFTVPDNHNPAFRTIVPVQVTGK